MTNFVLRLLVFLVGIPGLAALVIFLPHSNHLAFGIFASIVAAVGAIETASLFARKETGYRARSLLVPVLGSILPIAALLYTQRLVPTGALFGSLVLGVAAVLAVQAFRRRPDDFKHILPAVAANLTVLVYPGLFAAHVIFLSLLPRPTALLLVFMGCAFANDTSAYLAGKLFGRRRKPLLPISPKKTPVGFAVGFAFSIIVVMVAAAIEPMLFPGAVALRLAFGAIVGITVILGDLVESALKRSAEAKDSGTLIPGRGGVLDSIDSPIFLAPVFFYLYRLLFL